ncbi:mannonate dehydratase [Verrucomicrobiaceae bacterium N1E253]|uniref:Mannonate dehydratase n=1 Tax=Oceaniferula marina TaxID=2748318 RepID=A0A851GH47_9BACT|nr:mannonate dehydratase [Oceaniferula marina]NWK56853.1 mannonate dehydratase [Oceaniferula marina]
MNTSQPLLTEGFRWYGPDDSVSLNDIVQCGAQGVYTSLHHIPYGDAWPREAIRERLDQLAAHQLEWLAVESVPVSEAIKTRGPLCEEHLENYRQTIENLAAEGVNVVVYNFMPVLDWIRTDLAYQLPDGSEALLYDPVHFAAFDIHILQREGAENDFTDDQRARAKSFYDNLTPDERHHFERSIVDVFPGCKLGLSLDELREMLANYQDIDADQLRANYQHFLEAVVPTAERCGVRLAVHPDDPPFPVLGLPRIVSTEEDLKTITELVPSPVNGLCFCSGSLGGRLDNDLTGIIKRLGRHIHAVHLRSVEHNPDGSFYEANHLEGRANIPELVQALLHVNADKPNDQQLSFRPDHGHRMLDDLQKPTNANPGYDCLGRMRGLAEIRGLQTGIASVLV